MNDDLGKAVEVVGDVLSRLRGAATNEGVRAKLMLLDEACRRVVLKDKKRLTVPGAVDAFKDVARGGTLKMAEPSIRNKRDGANPFHELYEAWASVSDAALRASKPRRASPRSNGMLDPGDLERIPDQGLRALVRLIIADNRNLRSERAILKQALGAPVIHVVSSRDLDAFAASPEIVKRLLDEAEVDAIRNFIDPAAMKARGLNRAEDGAIETATGRALSDPGFADALDRILASQTA